ncbi:hypothetical protein HG530_007930 [Fusarium avenaceum]|nr:hypothetical protein HG530_007930 [Fusarium avenaceum]
MAPVGIIKPWIASWDHVWVAALGMVIQPFCNGGHTPWAKGRRTTTREYVCPKWYTKNSLVGAIKIMDEELAIDMKNVQIL